MKQIYFTRCPVPTTTAIAHQRGLFEKELAPLNVRVSSIRELGPNLANAHFTHGIDNLIREGGCVPPLWTRSLGTRTRLLGLTFMREPMSIYVRSDSPLQEVSDLAGRRLALPVWKSLPIDFWRIAARRGYHSILNVHGMTDKDVRFLDIEETSDPQRRMNKAHPTSALDSNLSEYHCQYDALMRNDVDALFAKGAESIVLTREAGNTIRKLYDLNTSPRPNDWVNNATPRLITCSEEVLHSNHSAVVAFCKALLNAAHWAGSHERELLSIVCDECGIQTDEVRQFFPDDYSASILPIADSATLGYLQCMHDYMLDNGIIKNPVDIEEWSEFDPLQTAKREVGNA